MTHFSKNLSLTAVACALLLSACGGGGGSTVVPVVNTPVGGPTVLTTPLVTSVPAATYSAGSEELAAFNLLNAERSACGFGLLKQNAALDQSTLAHANWMMLNYALGHYEVANTPGYTGVAPLDRMVAAGYSSINQFVGGEDTNSQLISTMVGFGASGLRTLLNGPYHAASMVRGYEDIGISVRNNLLVGSVNPQVALNIDLGSKNGIGLQTIGLSQVATYPCAGSSGVDRQLVGEVPNPVPGRNLATSPLGVSVQVQIAVGHTLTITSANMTNVTTGTPVPLRTAITAANDPNATPGSFYFYGNEGYVAADAPLAALTPHQVNIYGTNNGVAFSTSFTFTTGP